MGLLIDYLKKRNPWWEANYWKVDLILNVIFFAGLIGLMIYVMTYSCDDVYEQCRIMCEPCGIDVSTITTDMNASEVGSVLESTLPKNEIIATG